MSRKKFRMFDEITKFSPDKMFTPDTNVKLKVSVYVTLLHE